MPRTLSQLRDTILVACLAALSFLPPSGWQLCVGADGHWELEPASVAGATCCDDERAGGDSNAAAADECSDCTDYALPGGAAVGSRSADHRPESACDAPCVTPAGELTVAPPRIACPAPGALARPPRSAPGLRSTVLRC